MCICICVYVRVYIIAKNTVMNNLVDIFVYNYSWIFKKFCLVFVKKIS